MSGCFLLFDGFFCGGEGGFAGDLLLLLGRQFAAFDRGHLAEGAHGARGDANTTAINADGLEVYVLAAARGDIRVATRIRAVRGLAGNGADAGHMIAADCIFIHTIWQVWVFSRFSPKSRSCS